MGILHTGDEDETKRSSGSYSFPKTKSKKLHHKYVLAQSAEVLECNNCISTEGLDLFPTSVLLWH